MPKDHLSNEISVSASITDSGLSANVRSRAAAAFDRLLGALLDVPVAWIESVAGRKRDADRRASTIQDAGAEKVRKAILTGEVPPALVTQIALDTKLPRFVNKLHVVNLALDHLSHDEGTRVADQDEQEEEVDQDWLNHFGDYSERASSDNVRTLWASVLAGEIRKPGSFSLSTLRVGAKINT